MAITPPATIADFKAQFTRGFRYGTGGDFVKDGDIQEALNEATMNFNPALWESTDVAKIAFLYLSAHHLVTNVQMAGGLMAIEAGLGVDSRNNGVISQKSVGQVSVAYEPPPDIVKQNPHLLDMWNTQYGKRYVALMAPRLVGHVTAVNGFMDPGVGIPNVPPLI